MKIVMSVDGLPTTEDHARVIAIHHKMQAKVKRRANEDYEEWNRRVMARVEGYYKALERGRQKRAEQREFKARTRARVAELLAVKTVAELEGGEQTLWAYVQSWDIERAERSRRRRERNARTGGAA